MKAKKYDSGKTRYDLVDRKFIKGLGDVMTMGANKYGDSNWKGGIAVSRLYAAMQRHMASFCDGETNDLESGLNHLYHVAANIMMMDWTCKNKPGLNDLCPQTEKIKVSRLYVGVYGVLADLCSGWEKICGYSLKSWQQIDYMDEYFDTMKVEYVDIELNSYERTTVPSGYTFTKLDKFFLELDCLQHEIKVPIYGYTVERNIVPEFVTRLWLLRNGFPCSRIHTTGTSSKVDILKAESVEIFVDDIVDTVLDVRRSGSIVCYLMDSPRNRWAKHLDDLRINNLNDVIV